MRCLSFMACVIAVTLADAAAAQQDKQIGKTIFPTSCNPAARSSPDGDVATAPFVLVPVCPQDDAAKVRRRCKSAARRKGC